MDIVCRKLDCKHNKKLACEAKNIDVDENQNCLMYSKIEKSELDMSRHMFDVVPEIAPFKHNKSIKIACKSNCVMNCDGECKANGLLINHDRTIRQEAACFTHSDK